jgi:orotidine-5'-phosphate decarboxylase
MFDIGETVKQGVRRAAERGVSFATVHGAGAIVRAAEGKNGSKLTILVVPVLTSLDASGLQELGYRGSVAELIAERARTTLAWGCDGSSRHRTTTRTQSAAPPAPRVWWL